MQSFQELGCRLERRWLATNYNEELFPQLAAEELSRESLHQHVAPSQVADWLFEPNANFRQPHATELFGEPPVLLFQGPRFYIEALYWFSGTTSIHEHSFSGAFAVLAGSSLHSHWRFTQDVAINSRFSIGRLDRVSTEILKPGGVRPIYSGDRLIHQLFHLEVPSVTIVVRTYVDRHQLPQYRYMLPGLAIDDHDQDPVRLRRLLMIDAMARGIFLDLGDYFRRLISHADLETIYYGFLQLFKRKADPKLVEELLSEARLRFGDLAIDTIQKVCLWENRQRIIIGLRSKVTEPGPRFLLALLMLMPDRDAIFEAMRLQLCDLTPLDGIESLLDGLGKDSIGFAFDEINRVIFRGLVEGISAEELLTRIGNDFDLSENRSRLEAHITKVAASDLFFSLFSESPLRPSI